MVMKWMRSRTQLAHTYLTGAIVTVESHWGGGVGYELEQVHKNKGRPSWPPLKNMVDVFIGRLG